MLCQRQRASYSLLSWSNLPWQVPVMGSEAHGEIMPFWSQNRMRTEQSFNVVQGHSLDWGWLLWLQFWPLSGRENHEVLGNCPHSASHGSQTPLSICIKPVEPRGKTPVWVWKLMSFFQIVNLHSFPSILWALSADYTVLHSIHSSDTKKDVGPLLCSGNFHSISKVGNETVKKTKWSIHLFTRHLKNIYYVQNTELDIKRKHSWVYEPSSQKAWNVVQDADRWYGKKRKERQRTRGGKGIQI